MARMKAYGGAETMASLQGEPDSPATKGSVTVYGGGEALHDRLNVGDKSIGAASAGDSQFPKVYGGGTPMVTRPSPKRTSGSGDSTGAEQTDSP